MTTHLPIERIDRVGYETFGLLLGYAWQITVLFAIAALISLLLRNHRASIRHAIWAGSLLLVPLLPLLSLWVSTCNIPQTPVASIQSYHFDRARVIASPQHDMEANVQAPGAAANPPVPYTAPQTTWLDYPWALGFAAYLLCGATFFLIAAMGHFRIAQWIRGASPSRNERLNRSFAEAKNCVGIQKNLGLLVSDRISSPIAAGVVWPRIIFPRQTIAELSDEELRSILMHELAHVKRCDPIFLCYASLLSVFFFFHPLYWYAYRKMAALAEEAADDAVLATSDRPLGYAELLCRLASERSSEGFAANLAMGFILPKGSFLKRIEAILSPGRFSMRKLSGKVLSAILVSMTSAVALTLVFPLQQAPAVASELSSELGERFVEFPVSQSIGRLRICDRRGDSFNDLLDPKWEAFGPAQGKVTVPKGKDLYLEIGNEQLGTQEDKQATLRALEALNGRDLQHLVIATTNFTDEDFAALRNLTSLRTLNVGSESNFETLSIDGSGFRYLSKMDSLLFLSCFFTDITDESLVHLKPMQSLRYIFFSGCKKLTGSGLADFQALPNLIRLSFHMTPIGDLGLKHLAKCRSLENLNLTSNQVTDQGLKHLKELTHLRELVLPKNTTSEGLQYLSGLPNLERLNLQTRMDDLGLNRLNDLPKLKELSLSRNSAIGDEGLKGLSQLSSLEKISIASSKMTGVGLKYLKSIPSLKEIRLTLSAMNDEGMQYLEGLPITGLGLSNTAVTDRGLKSIRDLIDLKSISLDKTAVTDEGMQYFTKLKNLIHLRLRDTKITSEGLKYIKGCTALKSLVLYGTAVDDRGLEFLQGSPSIRFINLCDTKITDDGLAYLSSFPELEYLILSRTQISDRGIVHLRKLTQLTDLNLNNTELSAERVNRLRELLPGCDILCESRPTLPNKQSYVRLDEKAPDLKVDRLLKASDGAEVSWEAFKGKVVVLDFWATWCGPCVKSIPHINELARRTADKPVQFVMITAEEDEAVLDFLKTTRVEPWVAVDADNGIFERYKQLSGMSGIPLTALIDTKRTVVSVSRPDRLTLDAIEELLAKREEQ